MINFFFYNNICLKFSSSRNRDAENYCKTEDSKTRAVWHITQLALYSTNELAR